MNTQIESQKIMVSIHCLTYNHKPYIRQCLEGFVIQKTNFRFEAIVHDDASTDGTADIIKEYAEKYPDIIKPIFETENQYSKHDGSLGRIMNEACIGKYIAMCEGDDYWMDPLKLQKQVDFLESNLDYGGVYTKACVEKNGRLLDRTIGKECFSYKDLLQNNPIPTLTMCFKKELLSKYSQTELINISIEKQWKMGDYPFWLYMYTQCKIKFIEQPTSVYRILLNSASHSLKVQDSIKFLDSEYEIQSYFINNYYSGLDKLILKKKIKEINIWNKFVYHLLLSTNKDTKNFFSSNIKYLPVKRKLLMAILIYFPGIRNYFKRKYKYKWF